MSVVHRILGRGGQADGPSSAAKAKDGDAAAASAKPAPKSAAPPRTLEMLLEETRRKERRLKDGIAQLREAADTLKQRLGETEAERDDLQRALQVAEDRAREREAEREARIEALKSQLADARADLAHERGHRGTPAPGGRQVSAVGGSLLAQAKARG